MVVILNYGIGNLGSIQNMIRRIGGEALISAKKEDVESASALIMPGVGSFDRGMQKLKESGLLGCIESRVLIDRIPILGICLGMQLLFESSEEGRFSGLGWMKGTVKGFDFSEIEGPLLKVPHMGWNLVNLAQGCRLFSHLEVGARFYFVHSYHVAPDNNEDVVAEAIFGYPFTCAVQRDNIYGVQFHPEKSHKFGMMLFRNFLDLAHAQT